MAIGSAIGSSAIAGGLGHLFESADSIHDYENENASVFGAIDPLGTAFGHILGHSEKKKAKKQLAYIQQQLDMQYAMQKKAALEMPSLVRQGYEDAGYNALLALGNTGGATSALHASGGDFPHEVQRRQTNLLVESALENQKAQREQIEANVQKTKVDTVVDIVKALGTTIGTGIAGYLAYKKLGSAAATSAAGKVLDLPLKLTRAKGQVSNAMSSALPAAAGLPSLFSRAVAPSALVSSVWALQYYLANQAKKDIEEGRKPDVKVNPQSYRHRTSGLGTSPVNNNQHHRKHN